MIWKKNDNDVCTGERPKDVVTPQNPLGVAGRAVPEEDEDDNYDDDDTIKNSYWPNLGRNR